MALTPNLGMNLPTPYGQPNATPGPLWASMLNSSMLLVDGHDHTTGKGAALPRASTSIFGVTELNVDTDLPAVSAAVDSSGRANTAGIRSLSGGGLSFVTQLAADDTGTDLLLNTSLTRTAGNPFVIQNNGSNLFWVDVNGNVTGTRFYGSGMTATGAMLFNSRLAAADGGTDFTLNNTLNTRTAGNLFDIQNLGVSQMTVSAAGNLSAKVLATGTTTARALSDRFAEVFNVRDFGAVGDGVADDAPAFAAAIQAAKSTKSLGSNFGPLATIEVPPGVYRIATEVLIDTSIKMQGKGGYILCGVDSGFVFRADALISGGTRTIVFEDVFFRWYGAFGRVGQGGGIRFDGNFPVVVSRCEFAGLGHYALDFQHWMGNIQIDSCVFLSHMESDIIRIDNGGRFGDDVAYLADINNNFFQHYPSVLFGYNAINARDAGWNIRMALNAFEGHGVAISAGPWRGLTIDNNFFEACKVGIEMYGVGFVYPINVDNNMIVHGWPEWSAGTTYEKGIGCLYGGNLYQSLQSLNTGHQPDTSPTWWQPYTAQFFKFNTPTAWCNVLNITRNVMTWYTDGFVLPPRIQRLNLLDNYFEGGPAPYSVDNPITGYPGLWKQETQIDVESCQVIDDMQDHTRYALSSGTAGSASVQPGCIWPKAIEITESNANSTQIYNRTLPVQLDLTNQDYVVVPVKITNYSRLRGSDNSDPANLFQTLVIGADASNLFAARIKDFSSPNTPYLDDSNTGIWQMWSIPKSSFVTIAGAPNWNNIRYIQLTVFTNPTGGGGCAIRFGGVYALKLKTAMGKRKLFDPQTYVTTAQSISSAAGPAHIVGNSSTETVFGSASSCALQIRQRSATAGNFAGIDFVDSSTSSTPLVAKIGATGIDHVNHSASLSFLVRNGGTFATRMLLSNALDAAGSVLFTLDSPAYTDGAHLAKFKNNTADRFNFRQDGMLSVANGIDQISAGGLNIGLIYATYVSIGSASGNTIVNNTLDVTGGVRPGQLNAGGVTNSARIYSGSGAPNASYGNIGDFYFRTDTPTTSLQRLYVKRASNQWDGIL